MTIMRGRRIKMIKLKNMLSKCGLTTLASLALVVTTMAAGRICWMCAYQDELPAEAKKLRKF